MLLWSQQQEQYLILTKKELNPKGNIQRLVGGVCREKIIEAELEPVIIGNFIEAVLNVLQPKLQCVEQQHSII